MDWEPFLTPSVIPSYLAALLMVALAVWLLVVDFNRLSHRAFALFLLVRALSQTLAVVRGQLEDPAQALVVQRMLPYVLIPVAPLVLYFAALYPRPRGWIGSTRGGGWVVLGVILALEALYFLDHTLLWTVAFGDPTGIPFSVASGVLVYTAYGPLQPVAALLHLSYGLAGLYFALEYARSHTRHRSHSLLLVCVGFLLNALFDGALRVFDAVRLAQGEPFPWAPWGWSRPVLGALTLLPALAGVLVLTRIAISANDPDARRSVRRFLWVVPLPLVSAVVVYFPLAAAVNPRFDEGLASPIAQFLLGSWRLALPLLVTYALVRYRLFNIDVKVKFVVREGTVAAVFLLAFFLATEAAEDLVSQHLGWLFGLFVAGGATFFGERFTGLARRTANRLMPSTKQVHEMTHDDRVELFRERFRMAWEDGRLTHKERVMLEALGRRLGLEATEVESLRPPSQASPAAA